jgi:hypothetical protein
VRAEIRRTKAASKAKAQIEKDRRYAEYVEREQTDLDALLNEPVEDFPPPSPVRNEHARANSPASRTSSEPPPRQRPPSPVSPMRERGQQNNNRSRCRTQEDTELEEAELKSLAEAVMQFMSESIAYDLETTDKGMLAFITLMYLLQARAELLQKATSFMPADVLENGNVIALYRMRECRSVDWVATLIHMDAVLRNFDIDVDTIIMQEDWEDWMIDSLEYLQSVGDDWNPFLAKLLDRYNERQFQRAREESLRNLNRPT